MEIFVAVVLAVIAIVEVFQMVSLHALQKQEMEQFIDKCYEMDRLKEMIKRQNSMPIDMTEVKEN